MPVALASHQPETIFSPVTEWSAAEFPACGTPSPGSLHFTLASARNPLRKINATCHSQVASRERSLTTGAGAFERQLSPCGAAVTRAPAPVVPFSTA